MMREEVICAISTPPGTGAIAVVRVSGAGSIKLVDRLFRSPSGKRLVESKPNTVHFGSIEWEGTLLDEVLVSLFHAPRSFTGEESVEIACHGSVYIQQKLMELLISQGARLAKAGEFTRRAFRNGKFDLSQAEAVADLMRSTSAASHRVAMNQMRGGFAAFDYTSDSVAVRLLDRVGARLAEEDVEFANREELYGLVVDIEGR